MYLFNIEVGYNYTSYIRIDNNKKAKKFKTDLTSKEIVSSKMVTIN